MPRTLRDLTCLAAAAALLSACGGGEAGSNAGAMQARAPLVDVEQVRPQAVDLSVTLPGRVTASQIAEVRPQVSGIITERLFTEGAEVEDGAPLFRIDPATYAADLASAEADLARARAAAQSERARRERFAGLVERGGVSRQDYDDALAASAQAEAQVKLAEAAVDRARIALDRTLIKAPLSGHIGRVLVTEGALVSQGQASPLAVVTKLDPVYVDVTQSSSEVLAWRRRLAGEGTDRNLPVSLILEDGSTYEHHGELALAEVNVDPQSGSVTLRAVFPNPDGILLPGMFVRARLSEGTLDDGILVPQAAVSRMPNGDAVVIAVAEDGQTRALPVTTERAVGNEWLVTGINPGTTIVTAGFQRFRPGDVITPDIAQASMSSSAASGS